MVVAATLARPWSCSCMAVRGDRGRRGSTPSLPSGCLRTARPPGSQLRDTGSFLRLTSTPCSRSNHTHTRAHGYASAWKRKHTHPHLRVRAPTLTHALARTHARVLVRSSAKDLESALRWCREQQRAEEAEESSVLNKNSTASAPMPSRPRRPVVLAAHSAGAHLSALFLARQGLRERNRGAAEGEVWLPDRFVALSGVFDISAHFAHENTRLVHWLSPMWLAMIGNRGEQVAPSEGGGGHGSGDHELEYTSLVLKLLGLDGAVDPSGLAATGLVSDALVSSSEVRGGVPRHNEWGIDELAAWTAASPTRLLRMSQVIRSGASLTDQPPALVWPPTLILHGRDDSTVPVSSAREFVAAAVQAGLDADRLRYKEYGQAGHGEVMLALMSRSPIGALPEIARDFIREVSGIL